MPNDATPRRTHPAVEAMGSFAQKNSRLIETMYHVGTLTASDKGYHGSESMEGAGLSVSHCPSAWERIARLGGNPWWELRREGARFFIATALDAAEATQLRTWGQDVALVEFVPYYEISWFDDEDEDRCLMLVASKAAADEEAEAREGCDLKIERQLWPLQTKELLQLVGRTSADPALADDDLAIALATRSGLQGVWWDERLDPAALSAPRGVILAREVPMWASRQIPPGSAQEID